MRHSKLFIRKKPHIIQRIQHIKNPNLTTKHRIRIIHRHTSQSFIYVVHFSLIQPPCDIDIVCVIDGNVNGVLDGLEAEAVWITDAFEVCTTGAEIEVGVAVCLSDYCVHVDGPDADAAVSFVTDCNVKVSVHGGRVVMVRVLLSIRKEF